MVPLKGPSKQTINTWSYTFQVCLFTASCCAPHTLFHRLVSWREQNNTENPATRASWINHRVWPNWLFFLFSSSSLNKQLVAKSTHTEMHFKIQGECVVSRFHIILCVLLGFSGFFSAYFFNALPHTRNVWGEKMVGPCTHFLAAHNPTPKNPTSFRLSFRK